MGIFTITQEELLKQEEARELELSLIQKELISIDQLIDKIEVNSNFNY